MQPFADVFIRFLDTRLVSLGHRAPEARLFHGDHHRDLLLIHAAQFADHEGPDIRAPPSLLPARLPFPLGRNRILRRRDEGIAMSPKGLF